MRRPLSRCGISESTHIRLRSRFVVAPLEHTLLSWEQCFTSMGVAMELRHLRYIVAVAEAGRFAEGVARKMHTSKPSLSRAMRGPASQLSSQSLCTRAGGLQTSTDGQ